MNEVQQSLEDKVISLLGKENEGGKVVELRHRYSSVVRTYGH